MKYSIKQKNDSDKENAKQLELILNNKAALYDDIIEKQLSEESINKMLHDLTEFGMCANYITNNKGISIQSINPFDMCTAIGELNCNDIVADDIELAKMREPSFSININPFYPKSYASKDTVEIIDAILFQKQKQPKENHPYGWYRKFEKKRF